MNAFYFVTDETFVALANAQALWLRKLWPDCDVHLFIERRNHALASLEVEEPRITYHYEELSGFLPSGLPQTRHWPNIVFMRLFVPGILKQYHRLCYLDSDILCTHADPVIWDIELPHGLGMVPDYATIHKAPADLGNIPRDEWLASINVKSGRYGNSGMLLIDPAKFADYPMAEAMPEYFHKFPRAERFDQDFLNSYLDGKWTEIGPRFNFQAGILELGYERIIDPVFIHFCRYQKPWYVKDVRWSAPTDPRFYDDYAALLTAAGYDIADYARPLSLPLLRRLRYGFRLWLSQRGTPSRREKRARDDWARKGAQLYEYVNEGLRTGRFPDERSRKSIPQTTITPVFDGRYLHPESDGTRGPSQ